jgi:hypothetical protein
VTADGCVLRPAESWEGPDLRVSLWCTSRRRVVVDGALAGSPFVPVETEAGPDTESVVALVPADAADGARHGVAVISAWAPDGALLAERRVYRNASRSLRLELTATADCVAGSARIAVVTRSPDGSPVSARLALAVTDPARAGSVPPLPLALHLGGASDGPVPRGAWPSPSDPAALDRWLGAAGRARGAPTPPPTTWTRDPRWAAALGPGEGGPVATSAGPLVLGPLPHDAAVEVLRQLAPAFAGCRDRLVRPPPDLWGTFALKLTVDASGRVTAVTPRGGTLGAPALEACLAEVARGATFPPAGSAFTLVTAAWVLEADGSARLRTAADHRVPMVGPYDVTKPYPEPGAPGTSPTTVAWLPHLATDVHGSVEVTVPLREQTGPWRVTVSGLAGVDAGTASTTVSCGR